MRMCVEMFAPGTSQQAVVHGKPSNNAAVPASGNSSNQEALAATLARLKATPDSGRYQSFDSVFEALGNAALDTKVVHTDFASLAASINSPAITGPLQTPGAARQAGQQTLEDYISALLPAGTSAADRAILSQVVNDLAKAKIMNNKGQTITGTQFVEDVANTGVKVYFINADDRLNSGTHVPQALSYNYEIGGRQIPPGSIVLQRALGRGFADPLFNFSHEAVHALTDLPVGSPSFDFINSLKEEAKADLVGHLWTTAVNQADTGHHYTSEFPANTSFADIMAMTQTYTGFDKKGEPRAYEHLPADNGIDAELTAVTGFNWGNGDGTTLLRPRAL